MKKTLFYASELLTFAIMIAGFYMTMLFLKVLVG